MTYIINKIIFILKTSTSWNNIDKGTSYYYHFKRFKECKIFSNI